MQHSSTNQLYQDLIKNQYLDIKDQYLDIKDQYLDVNDQYLDIKEVIGCDATPCVCLLPKLVLHHTLLPPHLRSHILLLAGEPSHW